MRRSFSSRLEYLNGLLLDGIPRWISVPLRLLMLAVLFRALVGLYRTVQAGDRTYVPALMGIVPVSAFVLTSLLYVFVECFLYWCKRQRYAEWEGEYLEFECLQLRAWRHGGELWLAADDIAKVVDGGTANPRRLQATLPEGSWCLFQPARGIVINEAGLRAWLAPRTSDSARRLRVWLERNVFFFEARRLQQSPDPLMRKEVVKAHIPFRRPDTTDSSSI
ncbi:hypothetical protein KSF73_07425 [Burkholderiaceae bacterium DAT-1]|nr:hypothetical protein [Burkholderiaceae bacterium DAT-1]